MIQFNNLQNTSLPIRLPQSTPKKLSKNFELLSGKISDSKTSSVYLFIIKDWIYVFGQGVTGNKVSKTNLYSNQTIVLADFPYSVSLAGNDFNIVQSGNDIYFLYTNILYSQKYDSIANTYINIPELYIDNKTDPVCVYNNSIYIICKEENVPGIKKYDTLTGVVIFTKWPLENAAPITYLSYLNGNEFVIITNTKKTKINLDTYNIREELINETNVVEYDKRLYFYKNFLIRFTDSITLEIKDLNNKEIARFEAASPPNCTFSTSRNLYGTLHINGSIFTNKFVLTSAQSSYNLISKSTVENIIYTDFTKISLCAGTKFKYGHPLLRIDRYLLGEPMTSKDGVYNIEEDGEFILSQDDSYIIF